MSQLSDMTPGEQVVVNPETLTKGLAQYEARVAHSQQRGTLKSTRKELQAALKKVDDCDTILAEEGEDKSQFKRKREACEVVGEQLEKVDSLSKRLKAELVKNEDQEDAVGGDEPKESRRPRTFSFD